MVVIELAFKLLRARSYQIEEVTRRAAKPAAAGEHAHFGHERQARERCRRNAVDIAAGQCPVPPPRVGEYFQSQQANYATHNVVVDALIPLQLVSVLPMQVQPEGTSTEHQTASAAGKLATKHAITTRKFARSLVNESILHTKSAWGVILTRQKAAARARAVTRMSRMDRHQVARQERRTPQHHSMCDTSKSDASAPNDV